MIYIITEDGYSPDGPGFGLTFWLNVAETLNTVYEHEIKVISSEGNGKFLDELKKIYNGQDKFILAFDLDLDNITVQRLFQKIRLYVYGKKNVVVLNYLCFEHIMLTFNKLFHWIYNYPMNTDIKEKHDDWMKVVNELKRYMLDRKLSLSDVKDYCNKYGLDFSKSNEKLVKAIAADICQGKYYFNLGKGNKSIGSCWFNNCCIHSEDSKVYQYRKCGLKKELLTKQGKVLELITGTNLNKYFSKLDIDI